MRLPIDIDNGSEGIYYNIKSVNEYRVEFKHLNEFINHGTKNYSPCR